MNHRNINGNRLLCITFIVLYFILGCKENNQATQNDNSETPAPDISIKLNKEEAIEKVKYEINRTQKKITVDVHYWGYENKQVPCTQYDIDRGVRCSGEGIGAPLGYTNRAVSVRKCCRQQDFLLSGVQGQWVADYSQSDDKWNVDFEFSVDDVKKIISWIVSDKTGEVSEKQKI